MLKTIIGKENQDNIYFDEENFLLLHGDSLSLLQRMESESVSLIFADPPYFLSSGGITCSGGKMVSVDKGEWDKSATFAEIHAFNIEWLKQCKRILKKDGTIWISGTLHNIYSIGVALNELEYKILNNITWFKPNASPNLSCRFFTHSTETILWAKKDKKAKHYFNYDAMKEMNEGKQMRDVWTFPTTKKSEKSHGKHPTQKPISLLNRIILASSENEADIILDPFNGSGTTGIVCNLLNRNYIGIDLEQEYLDLTVRRYQDNQQLRLF